MSRYAAIEHTCATENLAIFGGFHPGADDGLPQDVRTVLMLGPSEPGFWDRITASPEWMDGQPDPVDRWSHRIINDIASSHDGRAFFPFGGPPYHPFFKLALRTGRAWTSPVVLLVHDTAGLFVSYRGALAFSELLELPTPPAASPCAACPEKPCLSACPPRALTPAGYDLPACHHFLDTEKGAGCLSFGCAVRRACPVSQAYGRLTEQSAYHMRLFHR